MKKQFKMLTENQVVSMQAAIATGNEETILRMADLCLLKTVQQLKRKKLRCQTCKDLLGN